MKFFKSWLIIKLCLLLIIPISAWPQALPKPQPERVNRAVSGVLQESMRARGFAANDPRFGNTLARISPHLSAVAGTSAAAVTVGTVTAPAWASVALAVGIGAVITYAVNLGIDALVNWLFGNTTIDESGAGLSPSSVPGTIIEGDVWCTNQGGGGCSSSPEAMARHAASKLGEAPASGTYENASLYKLKTASGLIIWVNKQIGSLVCPGGHFYTGNVCMPLVFPADQGRTGLTPGEAIEGIPESDLHKQLNPAIIAAIANEAWRQAASQPGYDGLPYPQSNPITGTEAAPWAQANPPYWPTIEDFVRPNPVTPTNPYPWGLPHNPTSPTPTPVSPPNTGTTNPAEGNPQANLGPDPGIGSPTLEPIPTARQIASPILQLAPDLQAFQASGKAGVCPRPSIELYGSHVLDAHCKLIDDNKAVLQLAMAFAWAALAFFIVLSA